MSKGSLSGDEAGGGGLIMPGFIQVMRTLHFDLRLQKESQGVGDTIKPSFNV